MCSPFDPPPSTAQRHYPGRPSEFVDVHEARNSVVPESGPFWGWKACRGGVVVQLAVPAEAKRKSGPGRECVAEFVDVLRVENGADGTDADVGVSMRGTEYRAGKRVTGHKWSFAISRTSPSDCGIHFKLTRIEARVYGRRAEFTLPAEPDPLPTLSTNI
jgi:hypothetical protein